MNKATNKHLLNGIKILDRSFFSDRRGSFSKFLSAQSLRNLEADFPVNQINHSITSLAGSIRGMHFQKPPHHEKKLISCIKGEILDVAVDLRAGSNTFLHYCSVELSAENKKMILIPEGFAHGFQTLSDDCELLYAHSKEYVEDSEGGLNPLDPILNIHWPLSISMISDRDKNHEFISSQFKGFTT